MCGRFVVKASKEELEAFLGPALQRDLLSEWAALPRYNVSPADLVTAVRADGAERAWDVFEWGLIPSWAKDPSIGHRLVNARAETITTKPVFRAAFGRRRCLIPVLGFYEWQARESGPKQPFYFHAGGLMALGGIWEEWTAPDGSVRRTCCVVTTAATPEARSIHHRLPVIIPDESHDTWLFGPPEAAAELLRPEAELAWHPVSRRVNRPTVDEPECIEPVPED